MGKTPAEVYDILNDTNILDDYIIKCYDTLHTLGREYLIDYITGFVNEKSIWILVVAFMVLPIKIKLRNGH